MPTTRFTISSDQLSMPKAASKSKAENTSESPAESPVELHADYPSGGASGDGKYTVVARRYRPRDFSELVGQQTVVQALTTAIQTNRVGHAYLFTGARGVGKTSSARIFAKALNASADGSGHFDPNSDVAQAIDSGEDMDVLEIDGASNRGIDEIRQLRASVSARPSRSPYKIYIIDEVHMLTVQAFNALLKTLEEPPPHVKFIFCTTDPEKVPITVLSRCQRFDFAPVKTDQILERLQFICKNEGATAEPEALQLIARRAAGSMRDSQSLLEQILSFADSKITIATVHTLLGTADESRLAEITDALIQRDNAKVLSLVHHAVEEGVDAGQLGEQILGYLRDMMTVGVGAPAELLRTANISRVNELIASAKLWGTATLLAAIQILDETLVRMRHSTQSRTLLEVAMVQICHLQDLQGLADLIKGLQAGKSPPLASSPSNSVAASTAAAVQPPPPAASIHPSTSYKDATGAYTEKKKLETTLDVSSTAPELSREDSTASQANDTRPLPALVQHAVDTCPDLHHRDLRTALDAQTATPSVNSSDVASLNDELASESVSQYDSNPIASELDFASNPMACWTKALTTVDGMVADYASMVVKIERSIGTDSNAKTSGDNRSVLWTALFPAGADLALQHCNESVHRTAIEGALRSILKQPIQLALKMSNLPPVVTKSSPKPVAPVVNQPTLVRKYSEHPLVKSLLKTIDGDIVRVDVKS